MHCYRGEWEEVRVRKEVWEGLRRLGRRNGATLYMVLLAGFEVLLQRYTGEEDLGVGTSVAGRTRKEIEGLIGFFVNMVALRVGVGGNPRFRELLGRVREVVLEGFAHEEVPFEAVVELQGERNLSYAPVFQVVFSVQNAAMGELELGGMKLKLMRV